MTLCGAMQTLHHVEIAEQGLEGLASLTFAHALGATSLRLYTNAAFTSNVAFYGRRGYVEYAREALSNGELVHMKKSLRDASKT